MALIREAGVAVVFADKPKYPPIADITTDFVYARLQDAREEEAEGYSPQALDRWVSVTRAWSEGESPAGLNYVSGEPANRIRCNVFLFMINGAKARAPAAAQAFLKRVEQEYNRAWTMFEAVYGWRVRPEERRGDVEG